MFHIFISYSRKDLELAKPIVAALTTDNLDIWIDWEDIPKGEEFTREIYEGIEGAEAFLFLFSPDSAQSEWCNREIEHAVKNGKRILPIVLRDTDPKITHPEISKRNWIFCRDGQDDFNKAIKETRKTIHTDYEWLKYHTKLQVKALDWERRKDASRLLRGKELREAEQQLASTGEKDPQPTDLQRQFALASRTGETRSRNILITIAFMVVIALGIAAMIAINQRNYAEEQRKVAVSRQLAAQASNKLSDQPDLALLLSLESYRSADTFEARDMMLKSLTHEPQLEAKLDFEGVPISLAYSSDGKYLAAGLENGSVLVWKTSSWEKAATFFKDIGEVVIWAETLLFTDNNHTLIVIICHETDFDEEKTCGFNIWNWETGIQKTLLIPNARNPIAISADGQLIAFNTFSGIQLWNTALDQPIGLPFAEDNPATALAFSPDRRWLLAGTCGLILEGCVSGVIEGWDISDLKLGARPISVALDTNPGSEIFKLAFDPGGSYLAAGSCNSLDISGSCINGEINLWNISESSDNQIDLMENTTSQFIQNGPVRNLTWNSNNGSLLAASGGDNRIYLYQEPDYSTLYIAAELPWKINTFLGSDGFIEDAALSPDGRWLAVAGAQSVNIWELHPKPALQHTVEAFIPGIDSLAFVDDEHILASDLYGEVWMLNLTTGKTENPSSTAYSSGTEAVFISPNGIPVAVMRQDDGITRQLINLESKKVISPPIMGYPEQDSSEEMSGIPAGAVTLNDEQTLLAASNGSRIVLWDITSSAETKPIFAMDMGGVSLAFNHSGRYLAVGGSDGLILLDLTNRSPHQIYPYVDGRFTALAFTPDDQILAAAVCKKIKRYTFGETACKDGEIRLWNLTTWRSFGAPLPTSADFVFGLVFNKDGTNLLAMPFTESGGILWNLNVMQDWTSLACKITKRNFTNAEWAQYFTGEEYRLTCPQWPAGE